MAQQSPELHIDPDLSLAMRAAEIAADLELSTGNQDQQQLTDSLPGPDSEVVAARLRQVKDMKPEDRQQHAEGIRNFYSPIDREFRRYGRRTQQVRVAAQLARALRACGDR
jgi:hypothetical protein